MKSFQDRLFKDFDVKHIVGKNGKTRPTYVYVGDYAVWSLTEDELQRYKRLYSGSGIVLLCLCIWKSLARVPLNSSHVAGAMSLLSLVALAPMLWGMSRFLFAKKQMYLRDAKEIKNLINWSSMIFIITQIAGVVSGIIFIIGNGADFLSVLVILAGAISAFLAFVVNAAQRRISYLEIQGEGKRKDKVLPFMSPLPDEEEE